MIELISPFLIVLGLFLYIHDLLYHMGLAPRLGREFKIGKFRVHHALIGIALILIGILLYC